MLFMSMRMVYILFFFFNLSNMNLGRLLRPKLDENGMTRGMVFNLVSENVFMRKILSF